MFERLLNLYFLACEKVYTWLHRVYFTEDEVNYLIDIVDMWVEAHRDSGFEAEDDEVEGLYMNMATAVDVRNKLWEQLHE